MRSGELLGKAIAEGNPEMYTDWVRAAFFLRNWNSLPALFAASIVARSSAPRSHAHGSIFCARSTIFRQIMADIFSGHAGLHDAQATRCGTISA